MRIVEIEALPNGAHRNQATDQAITVPKGWALIPDDMEAKSFPFGEITVEDVNGVPTVTKWTPGVVPESEPIPAPEREDISAADLAAAIKEGVNAI